MQLIANSNPFKEFLRKQEIYLQFFNMMKERQNLLHLPPTKIIVEKIHIFENSTVHKIKEFLFSTTHKIHSSEIWDLFREILQNLPYS